MDAERQTEAAAPEDFKPGVVWERGVFRVVVRADEETRRPEAVVEYREGWDALGVPRWVDVCCAGVDVMKRALWNVPGGLLCLERGES